MKHPSRHISRLFIFRLCLVALAGVTLLGCAGTTTVLRQHHLLLEDSSMVSVYFMRPSEGFMGVMDKPIGIDLDGERLMELSKGQYTMLKLRAGRYDMVVTNTTVEGPTNSMGEASRNFVLELRGTDAVYLLFKHEPTSFWDRFGKALGEQVSTGAQKLAAEATTVTIPIGERVTVKFYDSQLQNPAESKPGGGIGFTVESVSRGTALDAAVELEPVEGAQDSPLH